MCSFFNSLHLLSAMLFVIVYLLLNFSFYRFGHKCILIALFGMCWLILLGLFKVSVGWYLLDFFYRVKLLFKKLSRFFLTTSDSLTLYIWFLVWSVCTLQLLLFLCWQWQSFPICHSEYVFQISLEEYRICFFIVIVYLLLISLLVSEDQL